MLTSWTSLMVSCLCDGFKVTGEKKYFDEAKKSANFILEKLMKDGRLLRTYGRGVSKLNAYLEDYAYTIQAFLDLSACDADPRWLLNAFKLNEVVLKHFWDSESGGFYYTSDDHEELIARTKHFYDGSTPSASSVSVMNLIRLARLSGNQEYLDKAAQTMKIYTPYFHKAPDQFSNMLCALEMYLADSMEVVVVFDSNTASQAHELMTEIYHRYLPNAVVVMADISSPQFNELAECCPLLKDRPLQSNKATVYICKNFSCQKPITDKAELSESLMEMIKGS
jgi:uncharacterized protein YyaL (SSP411 family)